MTLTADEVSFHKICATDDIEKILALDSVLGGFHIVPNLPGIVPISSVAQILWKISPSIVKAI